MTTASAPSGMGAPVKMRATWQRFIDTMYWNQELEKE
jgi:hypothetical protein